MARPARSQGRSRGLGFGQPQRDILERMSLDKDTHLAVEVHDNLRQLLQRVAELKTQRAATSRFALRIPRSIPDSTASSQLKEEAKKAATEKQSINIPGPSSSGQHHCFAQAGTQRPQHYLPLDEDTPGI